MFIGHPYIWGWATWSENWKAFRNCPPAKKSIRNSFRAVRGIFSKVLFWNLLAQERYLQTWDISFAKYVHSRQLFCAIPAVNLIENLGFDSLATHTGIEKIFVSVPKSELAEFSEMPLKMARDIKAERKISKHMFRRLLLALFKDPTLLVQIWKSILKPKR
jgi:hypothetical protein